MVPEVVGGKNPIVDFGAMRGGAGHFNCPSCGDVWFHVHVEGTFLNLGCAKSGCFFNIKAITPNGLDQQGDIRCANKECGCREMALIVSSDKLCCGCRRCKWELVSSLIPQIGVLTGVR